MANWQVDFGVLCFGHLLSRFLYRRSAGRAYRLRLDIGALQTFAMVALVFGGEATLYPVRERPTFVEIPFRHSDSRHRNAPAANFRSRFYPFACLLFAFSLDLTKVPVSRQLQIA
jgi:hypothetical protein